MFYNICPSKKCIWSNKIKHAFVSDGVLSKVNFDFHAIGVKIQHSFGQVYRCISVQPDHSVSSENVGSAMSTEIK